MFGNPIVGKDGEGCRKQNGARNGNAENCFKEQDEELSQGGMEIPGEAAHNEIEHQKYHLSREEEIVEGGEQGNCQRKNAPPIPVDALLHGDEQQGEKRRDILKMIEKQVEQLEAGKGVQQTAHNGGVGILHKPADVGVSGQCSDTMLDAEQNGDGKCHPASWQNGGDPEERAAEQVEGIGADEVGAQIGVPVPAEATAAHGVVGKIIERNLLRIEIAVVDEIAAVCDDDGQEYQQQRAESQKKGQQVAPPLAVPGIGAKGNVFHEWCAPYSVCLRQETSVCRCIYCSRRIIPRGVCGRIAGKRRHWS